MEKRPAGTPGLDAGDWETVNAIALWAHAAPSPGALQAGTLERLAGTIRHRASMFDLSDPEAGGSFASGVARGMDDAQLGRYYAEFADRDYTTWCFEADRPAVYRDLDLVAPAARDRSAIYREWMAPQGLYYGCGAVLVARGALLGSITLFRERAAGEFSDRDLRVLLEVARHLSLRLDALLRAPDRPRDAARRIADSGGLTRREREVLDLMLAGATNPQMARALCVSESTLKKHVNSLYRKLGVRNRAGLAGLALS